MRRIGPDAVELGKQIGILTTEANRTRRDYRHALEHIKFLASEYIDDDFNWRIINYVDCEMERMEFYDNQAKEGTR
jgi:hypothetical protein